MNLRSIRFTVDALLTGVAFIFCAYLVVRSLIWTDPIQRPILFLGADLLIAISVTLSLFVRAPADPAGADLPLTAGVGGPTKLPVWTAILVPLAAAITPTAVAIAVAPENHTEPYATSYIGVIGILTAIVAVRRRPGFAWAGVVLLALGSMYWLGPLTALALGMSGSIIWTACAQLSLRFLDRISRDTNALAEEQRENIEQYGVHEMRRWARRVRVQYAQHIAGPVLERVIATGGVLSDAERFEAQVAEAQLRDELRGSRLLDERVRDALTDLRRRGSTVMLYDDGGFVNLSIDQLAVIRGQLAEVLGSATSEHIIVRTAPHPEVVVSIVGRKYRGSDEDDVDLWHEIPRPKGDTWETPGK